MENKPGQRTTLCINEAFCFLDSAEYGVHEATAPHESLPIKRAVSESGIVAKNLTNNKLRQNCSIDTTDCNGLTEEIYSDENSNTYNIERNENSSSEGNDPIQISRKDVGLISTDNHSTEKCISTDQTNSHIDSGTNNEIVQNNEIDYENRGLNSDEIFVKGDHNIDVDDDKSGVYSDKNLAKEDNTCNIDFVDDKRGVNSVEKFAKGDNNINDEDKRGGNSDEKFVKGDNINGCEQNLLVVPDIDERDSGCSDTERCSSIESQEVKRSSAEVVSVETENNELNKEKIDSMTSENQHLNSDSAIDVSNSCDKSEPNNLSSALDNDGDENVVKLRPKSVTSPSPRQRTTEIVSNAFCFLKEMDSGDAISRRSSGYKSSDIPGNISDELSNGAARSKVTNDMLSNDRAGSKVTDDMLSNQRAGSKVINSNDFKDETGSKVINKSMRSKKQSLKRQKSHKEGDDDDKSDDSSDDDTGIYNESFRNSCWICLDSHQPTINDSIDEGPEDEINEEDKSDDVFIDNLPRNGDLNGVVFNHKRSDSTATTASEREFKRSFQTRRKCFVQRNDSQQEYERMSCRVFENEKIVTLKKKENETGFGLHILDTQPVIISGVDIDSPASRGGIKEGQILLTVNGVSVLEATHDRIISLVQESSQTLQVEVANTDIHYIRDLQKPVMSGFLYKQKESTFIKSWKKRYCVLRQDNCLYYYKNKGDLDPLGAIPMLNYLVSRHQDSSKDHCFKAEKYGAKTYYFSVDNRDDMARWVGAMNEASMLSKKRKESWMDVTTHNVGLPALEVRKPECSGYLQKCARTTKTWQKRYCVLKDACIYYYKNMYSPRAQGMAHLHGYTIQDGSKKFSFVLKPPETQMRQFTFAADNDTDKVRWVDAMKKSIERWIKVD